MAGAIVREYRPTRVLGRGGCAVVYEAVHPRLGLVALKVGDSRTPAGGDAARRLLLEAELETRIAHPNVIRVHEVGRTDDGRPFVVMERLEGVDLEAMLARNGRLPVDVVCAIALQALDALTAIHDHGIVHRDLKPTNLMLTFPRGSTPIVKLIDFGAAHDRLGPRLTKTGLIVGTPIYLAPEQARGESIDHRVDLWALGVVLYELLTGRSPVEGDSLEGTLSAILHADLPSVRSQRPEVPEAIAAVVARAMARDPDERFAQASTMREALESALRIHGISISSLTLRPYRSESDPAPARVPSGTIDASERPVSGPRPSDRPPSLDVAAPERSLRVEPMRFGAAGRAFVAAVVAFAVIVQAWTTRPSDREDSIAIGPRPSESAIPSPASGGAIDEPRNSETTVGANPVRDSGDTFEPTKSEYARGLVAHARLATAVGLHELAYTLYREATWATPTYAIAWQGLAIAATRTNRPDEAHVANARYRTLAQPVRRIRRLRWR